MINNVNNLGTAALQKNAESSNRDQANAQEKASNNTTGPITPSQSGVQLSEEALKLEGIKKTLLDAPEVDTAKVDKIKEQIAQGTYSMDFENIADRMINSNK